MKIKDITVEIEKVLSRTQNQKVTTGKDSGKDLNNQKERICISKEAKYILELKEMITSASPDVRPEIIKNIQKALKQGRYNINVDAIADNIIKNTLEEALASEVSKK